MHNRSCALKCMSHYLFNGLLQLEEDFFHLRKITWWTNEGHETRSKHLFRDFVEA